MTLSIMPSRQQTQKPSTPLLGGVGDESSARKRARARQVLPRIRLEALSPGRAKLVLAVTYTALVVAVVIEVLNGQHLLSSNAELPAQPCAQPQSISLDKKQALGCVLPTPNFASGSMFEGTVTGLSILVGSFRLLLQVPAPNDAWANTVTDLSFDWRFQGGAVHSELPGGVEWINIAAQTNATVSLVCPCVSLQSAALSRWPAPEGVTATPAQLVAHEEIAQATAYLMTKKKADVIVDAACPAGKVAVCNDLAVLPSSKLSPNTAGGYTAYNFTLTFHDANIATVGNGTSFNLQYESAERRLTDVIIRLVLMVVTMAAAVVWWWRSAEFELKHMPGARQRSLAWRCCCGCRQWVPFRRWVGYLLIAVTLWQNPLYVTLALLPSSSAHGALFLAAAAISAVAWAMFFQLWLLFMDGLRYLKLSGSLPFKFYLPKVVFAVVFILVSVTQSMLQTPQWWACTPSEGACSDSKTPLLASEGMANLRIWLLAAGVCYIVLLVAWLVWFLLVTMRTSRVLRRLPYGPSRMQQLTFRFFMWQQWVVVAFVLALNLVPVVRLALNVRAAEEVAGAVSGRDERVDTARQVANALSVVGSGQSSASEYLVVTVYALVVAFVYQPPPEGAGEDLGSDSTPLSATPGAASHGRSVHTAARSMAAVEDGMKWLLASMGSVVGAGDTRSEQERFSLETACWLFDLAWAAYLDPPEAAEHLPTPKDDKGEPLELPRGALTRSGDGAMKCIPHDFELNQFIYDADTDTAVMVLTRGPRVVVAFRGTASKRNVRTDLSFFQKEVVFGRGSTGASDYSGRRGGGGGQPGVDTYGGIGQPPPSQGQEGADEDMEAEGAYCTWLSLACLRRCCAANCRCFACVPGVRQVLPLVHDGFWSAYASVRPVLRGVVISALADAGPDAHLYITGHSLGGALAQIAAYDMRNFVVVNKRALTRAGRISSGITPSRRHTRRAASRSGGAAAGRGGAAADPKRNDAIAVTGQEHPVSRFNDVADSGDDDEGHWYEDPLTGEKRRIPKAVQTGVGKTRRRQTVRSVGDEGAGGLNPYEGGLCPQACVLPCVCCDACCDTCCADLLDAGDIPDADLAQSRGDFLDVKAGVDDPGVGILPSRMETPSSGARGLGQSAADRDSGITVYSYGSPRVGNATFAALYEETVGGRAFRMEADGDFVTDIPKFIWMYKHTGTAVLMDVFGNIIVSPSFIETRLQLSSKTSFVAHTMNNYRRALINARDMIGLPLAPRLLHDSSVWPGEGEGAAAAQLGGVLDEEGGTGDESV